MIIKWMRVSAFLDIFRYGNSTAVFGLGGYAMKAGEMLENRGLPIIMAVKLDIEKRTERVLIGTEAQVRKALEGEIEQNLLYDAERRLGQLIFDFEEQRKSEWTSYVIYPMLQALRSKNSKVVWEGPLWDHLIEQAESDNAVSVYTAHNAILYYGLERAVPLRDSVVDIFERRMMGLVNPYWGSLLDAEDGGVLTYAQEKIEKMMRGWRFDVEVDVRLWLPWDKCDQEVAVADANLLPMIRYYLQTLKDSGCHLRICDCCGSRFFAASGHYTLCGKECIAVHKKRNEKEHNERAKVNRYDKIYKDSRQRMSRLVNTFIVHDGVSNDQIEVVEKAYDKIREEALKMKTSIKSEEDIVRFRDWLFVQERNLKSVCEDM